MKHLFIVLAAYFIAGLLTVWFSMYPSDLLISDPRLPLQKGGLLIVLSVVTPIECMVSLFQETETKLLSELAIFAVSFIGILTISELIVWRKRNKQ